MKMKAIAVAMGMMGLGCTSGKAPADSSSSTSSNTTSGSPEGLPDRNPQLAKKLVSSGALLLDVRTQQEWDERHLEGATHVPISELDGRLPEIETLTKGDKSQPIVTYCRSGARAGQAKDKLLKAGYTQVTNLGGIDDWPQ